MNNNHIPANSSGTANSLAPSMGSSIAAILRVPLNTILVPSCAAAISLTILLGHIVFDKTQKRVRQVAENGPGANNSTLGSVRRRVVTLGGSRIVAFNVARLLSCASLLALSLYLCLSKFPPNAFIVALAVAYAYVTVLSGFSFGSAARWNITLIKHIDSVLLITWFVFVYRDILPLATYARKPADKGESWLLWATFCALTSGAIIVPLLSPRQYVPYDPSEPMAEPNKEQTASILSLWTFAFVDSVIHAASRTRHLQLDQFPVLSDRYHMKHLMKLSDEWLNPLKYHRHLFWSLLRMSAREHFELLTALLLLGVAGLIEPFAVNKTLAYLESKGANSTVRPWAWIMCLFIGPFIKSVTAGQYFSVVQNMITRLQGIVTQVLFEHALRIRFQDQSDQERGASRPLETNHIVGKINNLIMVDLNALETGNRYLLLVFFMPLQIALSITFLYSILGWSVFVGVGTMIFMLAIPGLVAKITHGAQVEKMKKSDVRVQAVTETLGGVIRMIKLFGWEVKMSEKIDYKRQDELKAIRKLKLLSLVATNLNNLIPIVTMAMTYATYTLIMKESLTASRVFPSMTVFMMLQLHFGESSRQIPEMIQAKVALDRIDNFLHKTELLDIYAQPSSSPSVTGSENTEVAIRAASFTWSRAGYNVSDPGNLPQSTERNFELRIEDEVLFKRGRVNLILGRTGAGKTSMLMALLGEMHCVPLGPDCVVSLPRSGGVAYHAQESWVLNDTIRNNILFGSPYNEERYTDVIYQCALERDLALFAAGDETEIGERGLTLSGGQKARITLARAVYSSADILLLDDVLAALDVHTSKWIVDKCLKGKRLRGRTVILVTHNLALVSPIADYVVSLKDGRVISQGSLASALETDSELSAEAAKETNELLKAEAEGTTANIVEAKPSAAKQGRGKLFVAEEVAEGHVGWAALKLLFANTGIGSTVVLFWIFFLLPAFVSKLASALDNWVLGLWAKQYESHQPTDVSVPYYLSLYIAVVVTSVLASSLSYVTFVLGTLRASRLIHRLLIDTVLNSTLRWLDTTPSSRIIARCTQDIAAVDGIVIASIQTFVSMTFGILVKFGAVIIMSPVFAIPGALLCIVGGWLGQIYMKAQLAVKRERSNARAPVLGHFTAAIAGLVSIRAFGAQHYFREESYRRIDRYTRASITFYNLNRWIGVRGELLAAAFSTGLLAYLVYGEGYDASRTGFSITMAIGFSTSIVFWVRYFNQLEIQGNSLERIQQYLRIDQEPKSTPQGVPPAYWPSSGDLRVENLCARYSDDGHEVLHDLSFHIKSGERVGIVGRTGSGKSSLTLAILRAIQIDGKVYYDGIATNSINLDALRSNITIIPQMPELLTGTLRENIDPFSQFDDATLNDALRAAGLFSLQSTSSTATQLTLDSPISSSGSNVSVGQRQIIALARALVRRSKILILDEATSSIDYETDSLIQESLRNEVAKDVTLLTVAHRLQTVMDYDKIIVLEAGNIVELGKPEELLRNEVGILRSLVDAHPDREMLYAIAVGETI